MKRKRFSVEQIVAVLSRVEYNESRPHRALGEMSLAEYVRQSALQARLTD
jgi:transposase InsO family protein